MGLSHYIKKQQQKVVASFDKSPFERFNNARIDDIVQLPNISQEGNRKMPVGKSMTSSKSK